MSNFYIQYRASAVPIEELEGQDSNNKSRIIHSTYDKSVGGGKEFSAGTNHTYVIYKDYTTSDSAIAMNHASCINTFTGCDFIFIKIREAASTGTPDLTINCDGWNQKISGVDDCILLRPSGVNLSTVTLASSSATTIAKLDILVGKN
tara:strand:+ start:3667 stop:4110 length:444 start_codon:yes stop_codon:yes gene_type:complete